MLHRGLLYLHPGHPRSSSDGKKTSDVFSITGQETLGGPRPAPLDSCPAARAWPDPQPRAGSPVRRLLRDGQSPIVQVLQVSRGAGRQHSSPVRVRREAGQAVTNSSAKMGQGKKNKACAAERGAGALPTGAGPAPPQVLLKHCCLFGLAAVAHTEHAWQGGSCGQVCGVSISPRAAGSRPLPSSEGLAFHKSVCIICFPVEKNYCQNSKGLICITLNLQGVLAFFVLAFKMRQKQEGGSYVRGTDPPA